MSQDYKGKFDAMSFLINEMRKLSLADTHLTTVTWMAAVTMAFVIGMCVAPR